jgi:hypothetical protein
MSRRSRFTKVRLSPEEHAAVAISADQEGMTMCEYIRQQLLAAKQQLDVRDELAQLKTLLAIRDMSPDQATAATELYSAETLLLLRELVAGRDAHVMGVKSWLRHGNVAYSGGWNSRPGSR